MNTHTWQQWSAIGAWLVYMFSFIGMIACRHHTIAFFALVGLQALSVAWVAVLVTMWPQGGRDD